MIKTSPLGPTIETDRLILRPPVLEDFEDFSLFHQDEAVMKFLGGVQARATTWRTFNGFVGAWYLYGFSMFCLLDKQTGEWLGRIGPIHPLEWPQKEVGWGVKKSAEGKGYAREAAIATMDYAFDKLGWDKLIHCIAPQNISSQNLAKRLGSKNLGKTQLPPPFEMLDVDAWGQDKFEWKENRKNLLIK
jgi:RimJ/RimL family protein N-acetyltransferase